MTEQSIAARLRATWPKNESFGPITAAQRELIHDAAARIEELEREVEALDGDMREQGYFE